jgi:hypothetical protein
MRLYEIMNPSDPYTMEVEDFKEAAVGLLMLSTAFALEPVDSKEGPRMPMFLFGGMDKWIEANVCRPDDLQKWIQDHKAGIAKALESVLIGEKGQRELYQSAMEAIDDPVKREAFREKWHDTKLSSVNNIGGAAWSMAKRLLRKPDVALEKEVKGG